MSAVCLPSADCLLLFILAFRAQKDMGTYVIEGVELKIDAKIDLLGRQQPQRPPNFSCNIDTSIGEAAKHEVTADAEPLRPLPFPSS